MDTSSSITLDNVKSFVTRFLDMIRIEKKSMKKDMKHDNVLILHILCNETYHKSYNKICNSCNIKGLQHCLLANNNDTDQSNENNTSDLDSIIKNFNIVSFKGDKHILNMTFNYDVIANMMSTNSIFPYGCLDYTIYNKISNVSNIIITIDSFPDDYVQQIAFMLIYIGFYIQYINDDDDNNNNNDTNNSLSTNKFKLIKITSKDLEKLKLVVEFIKCYLELMSSKEDLMNIDCEKIIKSIQEKKRIDERIRRHFGSTRLNIILKKKHIENLAKNKMSRTQKYLNRYLNNCYNNNDDDDDNDNDNNRYINR